MRGEKVVETKWMVDPRKLPRNIRTFVVNRFRRDVDAGYSLVYLQDMNLDIDGYEY